MTKKDKLVIGDVELSSRFFLAQAVIRIRLFKMKQYVRVGLKY